MGSRGEQRVRTALFSAYTVAPKTCVYFRRCLQGEQGTQAVFSMHGLFYKDCKIVGLQVQGAVYHIAVKRLQAAESFFQRERNIRVNGVDVNQVLVFAVGSHKGGNILRRFEELNIPLRQRRRGEPDFPQQLGKCC